MLASHGPVRGPTKAKTVQINVAQCGGSALGSVQAKTVLDRSTALHYAAMRSKPLVLTALLDHGADVHVRAQGGNTALHQVQMIAFVL